VTRDNLESRLARLEAELANIPARQPTIPVGWGPPPDQIHTWYPRVVAGEYVWVQGQDCDGASPSPS
jgi:hypothetical protein